MSDCSVPWRHLSESVILVVGSPRSGTTWLAKIIDSHPDVLYRHEPDDFVPAGHKDALTELQLWLRERRLRAAAKRPRFRKSWRSAQAELARSGYLACLAAAQRLPLAGRLAQALVVPDLLPRGALRKVRAAVKVVHRDGSWFAASLPESRCLHLLRHPCGQIASVRAGWADGRFANGDQSAAETTDFTAAMAYAATFDVTAHAFRNLPLAARLAWHWRAFNEPAVSRLSGLPNGRIVIYEELCRKPTVVARELLGFTGLSWHPQTSEFLESSTKNDRSSRFYDVFRRTADVADRWRQSLSASDQEAIIDVVRQSPLARHWPDLAAEGGALAAAQ